MVIQCCAQQFNSLKLCKENDLLNKFIEKVKDSSDILSQSVAIEMLEGLARTDDGYDWLLSQDVLADILAMLNDEENPLAAIVQPGMYFIYQPLDLCEQISMYVCICIVQPSTVCILSTCL